jgi:hypothetical protein
MKREREEGYAETVYKAPYSSPSPASPCSRSARSLPHVKVEVLVIIVAAVEESSPFEDEAD